MAKKLVLATLIALSVTFGVIAQDAAKPAADATAAPAATPAPTPAATAKPAAVPAGPKVSYALTQMIGAETYDGILGGSQIYTAPINAGYSRTNFKAQVDFDLGSGLKIAPWIQDRFEAKLDPATTTLQTSDRFRNRFYAGINTTLALDKAFNIALNLEFRNATDLKTVVATPAVVLPESRFAPFLTFSGKIADFYYSIAHDLPIYFDMNGSDGLDATTIELEGTYNLGYGFVIDPTTTLKIDLNYYFDMVNIAYAASSKTVPVGSAIVHAFASEMRPKIILAVGDLAPFIGFLMSTTTDFGDGLGVGKGHNIIGATFGADVKLGANFTFNVTADVGADTTYKATTTPLVTSVNATLVIKG